MQATIRKQGNSFALYIPEAFARNANISKDTVVDLAFDDGRIVLTPVSSSEYSLDELLEGVTKGNLHGATDTGEAVGKEIW
ncbi:MAG: AbrB/MazE/SpoVT family DNA-binding domain-containing protein [Desulfobacteraceae bacterium]|nr:AbrB/MazE/SpoVT family DNA-binding domain-containing protein [Desulfobacteraceae bacterium]